MYDTVLNKQRAEKQELSLHYPAKEILVIDDDAIQREIAAYLLLQSGYPRPLMTDNGIDAVELVFDPPKPLALILLDMHLPDISGFEVCRRIRHYTKKVPIIAFSAQAADSLQQEGPAKVTGINDYLTKPVTVTQMQAMLNKWLRDDRASA